MFTIDLEDLARVIGGQSEPAATPTPAPPPNTQNDTIGVKVGDATVGMTKEGTRSNYALCLDGAMANKWTPEQIKSTCGTPPP